MSADSGCARMSASACSQVRIPICTSKPPAHPTDNLDRPRTAGPFCCARIGETFKMAGQLDRYPLCSLMTFLCNCRSGGLAFARPNGFEAGFKLLGLLGELFCVGFLQLCQITKLPADAWHLFKVRYVEQWPIRFAGDQRKKEFPLIAVQSLLKLANHAFTGRKQ